MHLLQCLCEIMTAVWCACAGPPTWSEGTISLKRARNRSHSWAISQRRRSSAARHARGRAELVAVCRQPAAVQPMVPGGDAAATAAPSRPRPAHTRAAVGQAQHKVGDDVLALPLLAVGRAHVPLIQLQYLVLCMGQTGEAGGQDGVAAWLKQAKGGSWRAGSSAAASPGKQHTNSKVSLHPRRRSI